MFTLMFWKLAFGEGFKMVLTGICLGTGFAIVHKAGDIMEGNRLMRDKDLMEALARNT